MSLRELARSAGVSNPYLSQIERGLRHPSADILSHIARALGMPAEALYVRAGILDQRLPEAATSDAIEADPRLTDRQRDILLEIYETFCRANAAAASS